MALDSAGEEARGEAEQTLPATASLWESDCIFGGIKR